MALLILGLTFLISISVSAYLHHVYAEASKVPVASGLTGAQVAERILVWAGIRDVEIVQGDSFLGDHYDPTNKRLVLSPDNYNGTNAAHLGVAAHECGHAVQHQQHYAPLHIRMGAVYATNFASSGVSIVAIAALWFQIMSPYIALWIIALCFGVILFFNLITLPVEYDASARAKRILLQLGIVRPGPEADAVNRTLSAAGLTYVAALITSLLNFAYYALLLTNRRD